MKFIISKELNRGRYYVRVDLKEITDEDVEKAKKFGFPEIVVKPPNGKELPVRIDALKSVTSYGFYDQVEADEYSEYLKNQIIEIKNRWANLQDNWSSQEEV